MIRAAAINSVDSALRAAAGRLARAGIPSPRREARLLLAQATGLTSEALFAHPRRALSDKERQHFDPLVERRFRREPLAQILARKEFWSLEFIVTAHTLSPRPESETLIQAALDWVDGNSRGRDAPLRLLDLGTGTGCLLLSLLSELPKAIGTGVDISAPALKVAKENARRLGLAERAKMAQGDWTDGVEGSFDLVLLNPPYIADEELGRLEPEVAVFEPRIALSGGRDGLDCYRAALAFLAPVVDGNGAVFIEIGPGQASAVSAIARESFIQIIDLKEDLLSIGRCLVGVPEGNENGAKKELE